MAVKGVYVVWLYLPTEQWITIGKLGEYQFRPGVYGYCGSAQSNLEARILRHQKKEKPLRWHIDYLRRVCSYLGAVVIHLDKAGECLLAKELIKIPSACYPVRGFGSSDCHCLSHLVWIPSLLPRNAVRR